MPYFKKKPVIIEAERVPGRRNHTDAWIKLGAWLGNGQRWRVTEGFGVEIDTLEGTMLASPGDWIVRGIQGELYPVKPDIFAETYEPAPGGKGQP